MAGKLYLNRENIKRRLLDSLNNPSHITEPFSRRLQVKNHLAVLQYEKEDFIASIYLNVLKRQPEPKGFNDNLNLLLSGVPKEEILYSFATSAEAPNISGQPINLSKLRFKLKQISIWRKIVGSFKKLWPKRRN